MTTILLVNSFLYFLHCQTLNMKLECLNVLNFQHLFWFLLLFLLLRDLLNISFEIF